MPSEYKTHQIYLRDVAPPTDGRCPNDMDLGALVVTYEAVLENNCSYTEGRYVSARLPVECLVLFEDGVIDPTALSADERDWLQAASREHGNEIDFAGTKTGPVVA